MTQQIDYHLQKRFKFDWGESKKRLASAQARGRQVAVDGLAFDILSCLLGKDEQGKQFWSLLP